MKIKRVLTIGIFVALGLCAGLAYAGAGDSAAGSKADDEREVILKAERAEKRDARKNRAKRRHAKRMQRRHAADKETAGQENKKELESGQSN